MRACPKRARKAVKRSGCGRSKMSAGVPLAVIWPPSMKTTRWLISWAKLISCVTTTMVMPSSASCCDRRTALTSSGSRAGDSSSRSTLGSMATARAIPTRCAMAAGQLGRQAVELVRETTRPSQCSAILRASALGNRLTVSPSMTLSTALSAGTGRTSGRPCQSGRGSAPARARRDVGGRRLRFRGSRPRCRPAGCCLRRRAEQVDAAQERSLAAARRADDRHDLAPVHVETDALQDAVVAKRLADPADLHDGRGGHSRT